MKQVLIRLSDDLHAQLKALAEREHRTVTAEVTVAVERHLAASATGRVKPTRIIETER